MHQSQHPSNASFFNALSTSNCDKALLPFVTYHSKLSKMLFSKAKTSNHSATSSAGTNPSTSEHHHIHATETVNDDTASTFSSASTIKPQPKSPSSGVTSAGNGGSALDALSYLLHDKPATKNCSPSFTGHM